MKNIIRNNRIYYNVFFNFLLTSTKGTQKPGEDTSKFCWKILANFFKFRQIQVKKLKCPRLAQKTKNFLKNFLRLPQSLEISIHHKLHRKSLQKHKDLCNFKSLSFLNELINRFSREKQHFTLYFHALIIQTVLDPDSTRLFSLSFFCLRYFPIVLKLK